MKKVSNPLRVTAILGAVSVALSLAAPANAQEFPNKPLRMVVNYAPGGSTDIMARMIAGRMGDKLGQTVLVENKPGGNATIGTLFVARAPADGYTLLIQSLPAVSKVFNKNLAYDTDKDFEPVTGVYRGIYVLAVNNSLPAKTVKEFIDYSKANPGKLNYGSFGVTTQLTMEMVKSGQNMSIVGVPYKGSAPVLQALVANEVQATIDLPGVLTPMVKDGRVRILAAAGDARLPQMPDVPTFAELGYPKVKASVSVGIWVPTGTPAPIVARLIAAGMDAVKSPEVTARLNADGILPFPSSPADLRRVYRQEFDFWAEAARLANFTPE